MESGLVARESLRVLTRSGDRARGRNVEKIPEAHRREELGMRKPTYPTSLSLASLFYAADAADAADDSRPAFNLWSNRR
jgi:hypothetical protein